MVNHAVLRSLSALIASLPASENRRFREEFDTVCISLSLQGTFINRSIQEFEDVQLTAFLSILTQSTNVLNDVCLSYLSESS